METVATTDAMIAATEHLELGVLGADAPSEAELTGKDKNRAGAKAVRYIARMLRDHLHADHLTQECRPLIRRSRRATI